MKTQTKNKQAKDKFFKRLDFMVSFYVPTNSKNAIAHSNKIINDFLKRKVKNKLFTVCLKDMSFSSLSYDAISPFGLKIIKKIIYEILQFAACVA